MRSIPLTKGGQGRSNLKTSLQVWPGLFKISLLCLLIACAALVVHVVNKSTASLEAFASARAHSIQSTSTNSNN